jgi:hypothetical protein
MLTSRSWISGSSLLDHVSAGMTCECVSQTRRNCSPCLSLKKFPITYAQRSVKEWLLPRSFHISSSRMAACGFPSRQSTSTISPTARTRMPQPRATLRSRTLPTTALKRPQSGMSATMNLPSVSRASKSVSWPLARPPSTSYSPFFSRLKMPRARSGVMSSTAGSPARRPPLR